MHPRLPEVIKGLQRLGLPVVFASYIKPRQITFLPGVWIKKGTLFVQATAHPSDVLHEAGHLAIIPSRFRKFATGNVNTAPQSLLRKAYDAYLSSEEHFAGGPDNQLYRSIVNSDEQAAIAWSYAAALEIKYDTHDLFVYTTSAKRVPYGEDGEYIYEDLSCNHHPGIHALHHSGMIESVMSFPTLTRWLQL